jgi:alpha-L-rhamnosidase/Concanavalin A-like lectin/glucanases superfamily
MKWECRTGRRPFPEEFRKRRGYDLVSYLPTLTGRVVDSTSTSEQFLWDFRRTQADLMAENYYGHFTELCHQHGITTYAEPYGTGNFEELQAGGRVDRPMGEFWLGADNSRSVKLAASVGHVFGKQVIGAESFTGFTAYSKWQEYPFNMKATGDWMFTQGINRFYFHRFAHQPHPTAQPGMTMGPWGFHFDRTNTWFEQSKPWMDYLARCQFLLQQGHFVADLLYYGCGDAGGVETPVLPADLNPAPPEGYQWDVANDEVILTRIKIVDGQIVLPDGMKYRLLILPANIEVTLEVYELVKQGLTLVGARPKRSPSLSDQKRTDEFNGIAGELWGDLKEHSFAPRGVGSGQVFWDQPLVPVLDHLGVRPDFTCASRSRDAPINFIHRMLPDADVYFIANRRRRREEIVVTVRIQDRQPELWDPSTGKITPAVVYELFDDSMRLPLVLEPAGSVFVVFRAKPSRKPFYQISKNDNTLISTTNFPVPSGGRYREITNNFTISVWAKPETDIRLPPDLAYPKEYFSYLIYPPAGEKLYGPSHVACGLTAGRNGVLVFERGSGIPRTVLKAERPLAGRTHIAVVYERGAPALFLDGELIERSGPSGKTVNPGLGEALQSDNAYYFNGDMTEPQLFTESLSPDRIRALVARGLPSPEPPIGLEQFGSEGEFLFWQNGRYSFRDHTSRTTTIDVAGIDKVVNLEGAWRVSFPPNLGAPSQITLGELFSLHRHPNAGVKYFSGTASYRKEFVLSSYLFTSGKRLFLDLGRVEVLAEVSLNHRPLGIFWKEPYRVEITEAVKPGQNNLEIAVTNLWPNRLIGDEQLPAENEYYPGRGYGGDFPAGLKRFPDWYVSGNPKPPGGRVTFSSWKHYNRDSPLLESGLLGPVVLRSAVVRRVN